MFVFGRLGILGRLVLILLLLLAALVALGFGLSHLAIERNTPDTPQFPFPGQAAAIVELLDATPPPQQELVLRAVGTRQLGVSIVAERPAQFDTRRRMPGIEWLIGQYLETVQDRAVFAVLNDDARLGFVARAARRFLRGSKSDIEIAVELGDGRFVLFHLRSVLPQHLFGIPVGFWIGVFGSLFAALALWAIAREARPLRRLAASLQSFGEDGAPRHVERQGAPEIARLIDAVNLMQERIAALIKGRTILLGAVSHDLKTYITRLRLRIEQIPAEEQRERAESDLDDMTRLIDDAIAVARGASQPERPQPVDLASLLQADVAARADERVTLDIGVGPHRVLGDEMGLKRLFANLIDNGLRYGERLHIAIGRRHAFVQVTFDDDGPGIPAAERQAVFEPFFRLEASRNRKTGGSGLGLAIVKQIAEAHGGRIDIATSPAGGARLIVVLPAFIAGEV